MIRVYGYSDDNVVIDGDYDDEIGCYNEDVVIVFSDNTVIRVGYSKVDLGVWWIDVANRGFENHSLQVCTDENAEIYSDVFEIDANVIFTCTTQQKYPAGRP